MATVIKQTKYKITSVGRTSLMVQWLRLCAFTAGDMGWSPCGSDDKESTCNAGDLGSIPGLGRSPGEGKGYPLQYSGLENPMDYIVHGVTKSCTQLSDFHFTWLHKEYPTWHMVWPEKKKKDKQALVRMWENWNSWAQLIECKMVKSLWKTERLIL